MQIGFVLRLHGIGQRGAALARLHAHALFLSWQLVHCSGGSLPQTLWRLASTRRCTSPPHTDFRPENFNGAAPPPPPPPPPPRAAGGGGGGGGGGGAAPPPPGGVCFPPGPGDISGISPTARPDPFRIDAQL